MGTKVSSNGFDSTLASNDFFNLSRIGAVLLAKQSVKLILG